MSNKISSVVASILLSIAIVSPALAQGNTFDMSGLVAAGSGSTANVSAKTGSQTNGNVGHVAAQTSPQWDNKLHLVSTRGLTKIYGITGYQSLVGWGSMPEFGNFGGGPNMGDTYNQLENRQAVLAQENAMAWQEESDTMAADSADTNPGTGVTDSAAGF